MKINYGIIAVDSISKNILHFCGYENKPTTADFVALRKELESNEEFGLTEKMETVILIEANAEILKLFTNNQNKKWHTF